MIKIVPILFCNSPHPGSGQTGPSQSIRSFTDIDDGNTIAVFITSSIGNVKADCMS